MALLLDIRVNCYKVCMFVCLTFDDVWIPENTMKAKGASTGSQALMRNVVIVQVANRYASWRRVEKKNRSYSLSFLCMLYVLYTTFTVTTRCGVDTFICIYIKIR